jgi:hypothetical protein
MFTVLIASLIGFIVLSGGIGVSSLFVLSR